MQQFRERNNDVVDDFLPSASAFTVSSLSYIAASHLATNPFAAFSVAAITFVLATNLFIASYIAANLSFIATNPFAASQLGANPFAASYIATGLFVISDIAASPFFMPYIAASSTVAVVDNVFLSTT